MFKAYSVQTLAEATSFIQDLKLGHYIKVPPRATFLGMYYHRHVLIDLNLGRSTINCNDTSILCASWRQDLDFCQCQGHLRPATEESAHMSPQPSVLHCFSCMVRKHKANSFVFRSCLGTGVLLGLVDNSVLNQYIIHISTPWSSESSCLFLFGSGNVGILIRGSNISVPRSS